MTEKQTRYEWGIKHSQGIRRETSRAAAEESLVWMTTAYERNFRNKVRPVIVCREVTEWEVVSGER